MVLFAHGSGSSQHSPRNNHVARVLHAHSLGTLLLDLLTPEEDLDYSQRFDIPLLARRLLAATRWLQEQQQTAALPLAYFGASTGAAAARRRQPNSGRDPRWSRAAASPTWPERMRSRACSARRC